MHLTNKFKHEQTSSITTGINWHVFHYGEDSSATVLVNMSSI